MIGIIDYGAGNMFSLKNALNFLGVKFSIVTNPSQIDDKTGLILPGVGAFPEGIKRLTDSGIANKLKTYKKPLLGICLGMQLLFEESEEFTPTRGLGLIPGRLVKITGELKIPHMGWNELEIINHSKLTINIPLTSYVYFVHSYKAITQAPYIEAITNYGGPVCAIVSSGNVAGTQFHPEISGEVGLKILMNFVGGCL
ncbi:MAG: imidazole glycerol phosphate synthase subunit HisH [Christensenellaceae bacterium]|jgi:glutamine amidotransferase|nr:imidazole glycerol phosphate synthase subunit HisH [Christensenellaceae bacterium]